jgi:hypothetical protein
VINFYRVGRTGRYKLLNCLECNPPTTVAVLTKAHMRIQHNMTKEEYCKKHPEHAHPTCWGDLNPDRREYKQWRGEGRFETRSTQTKTKPSSGS